MGLLSKNTNPDLTFSKSWRNDLIAAISVSLVAMPLGLGIAVACGIPPIAGLLSAIVGGLFTSFIRSSHIAINGPTAGLIAIIIAGMQGMDDGSGNTYNYMLASFVCAGLIQVILGAFKWGKVAEIFPSTVINGILAAIGIIIIAKQIPVAIGTEVSGDNTVDLLINGIKSIPKANLLLLLISLFSILLLIFHARISYKVFHILPAPIWVLLFSILISYMLDFKVDHIIHIFNQDVEVGPQFLINISGNLTESILTPNFGMIGKPIFWLTTISITLVATVETLAAAKAIDRLDPYKRKTDLNKDLMAIGLSTMLSGAIGGLPIISVIVRTTVNIQNNAKTTWSNFFHGALILVYILALSEYLQMIPLAALASILIFMGFKLASPRLFKETYAQGLEQLLFLFVTILFTLYNNLLVGIVAGMFTTLLVHVLLARQPLAQYLQSQFFSRNKSFDRADGQKEVKFYGIANFLNAIRINNLLASIEAQKNVLLNVSKANIVDLTISENLYNFKNEYERAGGTVTFKGLDLHTSSTNNKLALKSLKNIAPPPLNPRQKRIHKLALENGWEYRQHVEWDISSLSKFKFFDTRPIEFKENVLNGKCKSNDTTWELSDITFDEGALSAKEIYHTTVEVLFLDRVIPIFVLENESFLDKYFDRVLALTGQKDIDLTLYPTFSRKFLLKGKDESRIRKFFTPEIVNYLESEEIYHIESNGESLLIFRNLRVAKTEEIKNMIDFSENFINIIAEQKFEY